MFWLDESLPAKDRVQDVRFSIGLDAIFASLRRREISFLLLLIFATQVAFMGFEQFFPIFTLGRLGLNGSGNAALFVMIGILLVIVQGGLLGRWSKQFGNRSIIFMGLATLGLGLILTAFTPPQAVPWYSQANLTENLAKSNTGATTQLQVDLPPDGNSGWLGLIWIVVAMLPVTVGASVLQPSVNSLITQQVGVNEVGAVLGVSASFSSIGQVFAPIIYGAIFQWAGSTMPFVFGGVLLLLLATIARKRIPT
jgi:MFS family permease